MAFRNRAEYEEWCYYQFRKYGIRMPDTYTEDELIDFNPGVPVDFIKQHVQERDAK